MNRIIFFLGLFLIFSGFSFFSKPSQAAESVVIGAYINDIQEISLPSHSYRVDLYVWFRWRNPAIDPSKTFEFMNIFDPVDHVRSPLYARPQKMPDGSYYMAVREQGKFSVKFPLQKYPFDSQRLRVMMEDSVHDSNSLVYTPDTADETPVFLDEHIHLPGFNIGKPAIDIINFSYPTRFGDISQKKPSSYSRALIEVPIARPWLTSGIKAFFPIFLVVFCTALILFVHPAYIEGRLGVAITLLLTLVALQLTTTNNLPEIDYLLTTDKVYLLSYVFIIATMMQLVRTSRLVQEQKYEAISLSDRRALRAFCLIFLGGLFVIFLTMAI